jgi:hypothetical protein
MYLTIIKNGQVIDHRDFGINCLSFSPESLNPQNEYEILDGRHGLIPLSTTFGGRVLHASFYAQADDHTSYQLLKNIIFSLFSTENEMYLIDSRQPDRRWSVKVSNSFGIDNFNYRIGKFNVDFLSLSPFAESVDSTLEQQFAQISGNTIQKYRHTTTTFEILNDSDTNIDPRVLPLVITFSGPSSNLIIKNNTTGDEWNYTGSTVLSDIIEINGIRSTKNGLSIFSNTNRKLINMAPGWNDFQLIGATDPFEISFDFRFYTL